jgi:3-methyladenine DNA glycosylase AlkD
MSPTIERRPAGETTARAVAFVAARRADAEELGRELADSAGDPETFARSLRDGFARLADPEYLDGQQLVAPGIGRLLGVRWPLHGAVARGFRRATRRDSASTLLFLAERLFRDEPLELRWFAFGLLERTVASDPERTWQLLRRAAREAGDWITVDTLAHPCGRGILLEPYRWSELEQLVYSSSPWERRLVGSTIATIPHLDRRTGRTPEVVNRALPLLGQLIGDSESDVQKALAWAYRTVAQLDPSAVTEALARETEQAVRDGDGHRAWVIRDALGKLPVAASARLRDRLTGVRKRPGAPSTSTASQMAARFEGGIPGGGAVPATNERSLGRSALP